MVKHGILVEDKTVKKLVKTIEALNEWVNALVDVIERQNEWLAKIADVMGEEDEEYRKEREEFEKHLFPKKDGDKL